MPHHLFAGRGGAITVDAEDDSIGSRPLVPAEGGGGFDGDALADGGGGSVVFMAWG